MIDDIWVGMLKRLKVWWHRMRPPPNAHLERMTLVLLERSLAGHLQGQCVSCGKYQPIYLHLLIEKHGKTTLLSEVQPHIPCLFCKEVGSVVVTANTS